MMFSFSFIKEKQKERREKLIAHPKAVLARYFAWSSKLVFGFVVLQFFVLYRFYMCFFLRYVVCLFLKLTTYKGINSKEKYNT